jgi:hypothetical protein
MKAEHPKALLVTGIVIGGLTLGVVPAAVTYAVTRDLLRTSAALGAGSTLLVCIGNRLHARADQLDNAV